MTYDNGNYILDDGCVVRSSEAMQIHNYIEKLSHQNEIIEQLKTFRPDLVNMDNIHFQELIDEYEHALLLDDQSETICYETVKRYVKEHHL